MKDWENHIKFDEELVNKAVDKLEKHYRVLSEEDIYLMKVCRQILNKGFVDEDDVRQLYRATMNYRRNREEA